MKNIFVRFTAGLGVLAITLFTCFAWATAQIPHWGATPEEVARRLPGDELAPEPLLNWTNAIEINAPPEQVWPWVAQLGDTRGGFYSYTFIEDRVGALAGAADYNVNYENADRIHAEWQNPQPDDGLIQGSLKIREVKTGQYLLGEAVDPNIFQWVWLWHLSPLQNGAHTRLIVRFRIQLPNADENPTLTTMMTVGGFVMQQRMLHGLKLWAEGGVEPTYIEGLEIALWLVTLFIGLAATVLYMLQAEWGRPLAVAVISVCTLIALTFIQPEIWVRILINLMLLVGLWWVYRLTASQRRKTILRPTQASAALKVTHTT